MIRSSDDPIPDALTIVILRSPEAKPRAPKNPYSARRPISRRVSISRLLNETYGRFLRQKGEQKAKFPIQNPGFWRTDTPSLFSILFFSPNLVGDHHHKSRRFGPEENRPAIVAG
jgi:hypothetical protein